MADITVEITESNIIVIADVLPATSAAASAATATTQAGIATAAAVATAADRVQTGLDAGTATTQAGIATTQAGLAAADAVATAADRVQTGLDAGTATTQAGIATTQAGLAAADAVATAADRVQTGLDATTATTQAGIATTQAGIATTQAGTATTQASSASGSASAAAGSATTATNQAAAAAGSALSAASVVSQDLSAIDRTVFSATLVDAFLYDTSKDSDGGAWRKRCSHTSWENETLSGNWLGSAANEAAARAISGAVTGSLYYDTTAAVFRTLNAGSGVTAAYRGNTRQFPAKVLITVEAARVVIWDLTQAGVPMWMVFIGGEVGANWTTGTYIPQVSGVASMSSAAALNGTVLLASNAVSGVCGVNIVNFIKDSGYFASRYGGALNSRKATVSIGSRNAISPLAADTTTVLANAGVNDVAMTVLPNAPADVATGLPIPTIDVFTDAGTSRINTDGTVADLADTAGDDHKAGCILASGDSVALNSTNGNVDIYKLSNTLADTLTPDRTYDQATVPALLEAVDAGDKVVAMKHRLAIGQDNGVNVLIENPASVAAGMIAYVTKDYNSGWQVGAIKGAWLADTVAETLTGAELVSNGDFGTDTTGWTGVNATLSVVSGAMRVTATAGSPQARLAAFTTVVGKTYVLKANLATLSVGGKNVFLAQGPTTAINESSTNMGSTVGPYQLTFVASSTTTYVGFTGASSWAAAEYFDVDAVSCRPADVDRSVKAKGLQVFGSLTKATVASGAQLMGYSGFSAANYFEQPYNSDLDFGTGDFCIMGWLNVSSLTNAFCIYQRGPTVNSNESVCYIDSAGAISVRIKTTAIAFYTAAGVIPLNAWKQVAIVRASGIGYIYVDGRPVMSVANTENANQAYPLILGKWITNPIGYSGTMTLWRAGATAPSAEQIKHIYETERPLFEAGAQCCLAGTSNAVTALAYCEETGILHVGTSWGRSPFKDLLRVASEATGVGAITALAAGAGTVAQAGATAVDVYVPAYLLREELLRDAEQMAKFGQNLIAHDFTATASQTTFTLPVGWEIVAVYQQGSIKRETTSWTRSFDGFIWSVVLGTGATVSDWISILAKRV